MVPLFMDRHEAAGATAEDVAKAHMADLQVQDRYGVRYISYWFDPDRETIFCLADAPDKDAAEGVHREAHGLMATDIIEVDFDLVKRFLGQIYEPAPGEPIAQSAFRTILFTDMTGSTQLSQSSGDEAVMKVLRVHDRIVRSSLQACNGHEVKHTGDGIMACFRSVVDAARCAVRVQQELATAEEDVLGVRVGMAAGEPVNENGDFFGATVNLAARICDAATAGDILASNAVRELSLGKGFAWDDKGELTLKGFDHPVHVHQLLLS